MTARGNHSAKISVTILFSIKLALTYFSSFPTKKIKTTRARGFDIIIVPSVSLWGKAKRRGWKADLSEA